MNGQVVQQVANAHRLEARTLAVDPKARLHARMPACLPPPPPPRTHTRPGASACLHAYMAGLIGEILVSGPGTGQRLPALWEEEFGAFGRA
jgi:hypothetical protein